MVRELHAWCSECGWVRGCEGESIGGECARDIESLDDLHGRDRNHAKDAGRAQSERVQNGEPADEGAQSRRVGAADIAATGEKYWRVASP